MSLDIQQREREGITILDFKGRLTMGEESVQFRGKVEALIRDGISNLILNLAGVDYIDSTGLGTLVICSTSFRKANGTIKLLNVNKRNIELLVMTKLATVFEFFSTEQDAINSFFPDRAVRHFDILDFVREMKEE